MRIELESTSWSSSASIRAWQRIADAIERELTKRVTASHALALAARGTSLERLHGPAVDLHPGATGRPVPSE